MGGLVGLLDFVGYAVGDPDNIVAPGGGAPWGSMWLMGDNNVPTFPWLGTK